MAQTAEAKLCVLQNPVFTALGTVTFRRAESDGVPVMAVALGEREAALALPSLQREFCIPDDSADGEMLRLIAEALNYVTALQIGDELPREVLDGKASWSPSARHQWVAAARIRMKLLTWVDPSVTETDAFDLRTLESDPQLRAAVQRAFEQAATALGLPGTDAVMALVAEVAEELAYIEALRDTLLARVQALAAQIAGLSGGSHVNSERQTTLIQVRRLTALALQNIGRRFADVDAQTGMVLSALGNADGYRTFIRSNRDWLFCSRRAWESVFADWAGASPTPDEFTWPRLSRTYHFLAPRFMPVQEWTSVLGHRTHRRKPNLERVMHW